MRRNPGGLRRPLARISSRCPTSRWGNGTVSGTNGMKISHRCARQKSQPPGIVADIGPETRLGLHFFDFCRRRQAIGLSLLSEPVQDLVVRQKCDFRRRFAGRSDAEEVWAQFILPDEPQKILRKSWAWWTGESAAVSAKRGFLTDPAAGVLC